MKTILSKTIFLSMLCLIPPIIHAQNRPDTIAYGSKASEVKKQLEDGYTLQSGWTINAGDTLVLGKGTLPNKAYAFIYYFSSNGYDKTWLMSNSAKYLHVKEIFPYGTKKAGFTIMAKVGAGELLNYWVELDNAADAGEIIPPKEYSKKAQAKLSDNISKADELKKWKDLLDTGGITQEEYDAQKKKILEQP